MNNWETVHGGDVDRVCREYGFAVEEVLDFSANINPLPLPEGMAEYLADSLAVLTRYPDREYRQLREALARYTGCSPRWIMVGNGATELLYLAAKALKPGKVLIPAPSFADFTRAFAVQGSRVDFFPLREQEGFKLDIRAFCQAMGEGYGAAVLCNPNNPTGQLLDRSELVEVVGEAAKLGIMVILDETFLEFAAIPDRATMLGELGRFRNLLILRAFTKFFGVPGLRLGYCLANPELLQELRARQEPWTVNGLAALLGPWLLEQTAYIDATRSWIREERPFFLARLKEIAALKVYDTQANFVLCRLLSSNWNAGSLKGTLERQGIMIRDAGSFYLDEKYFRLAIRDRESNLRVAEKLEDLLKIGYNK